MKLGALTVASIGALSACAACAGQVDTTPSPTPPPSVRVERSEAGVWWFVAPDGTRFYSMGINNISPEPYKPRPGTRYYDPVPGEFGGDAAAWGTSVRNLLVEHGFNTYGAWSSESLPAGKGIYRAPVLYVVGHTPERCLRALLPQYEGFVRDNVREGLARMRDRAGLLGVFLDNEMPWFGKSGWDDIPTYTLLEKAIEQPMGEGFREAAIDFLKQRHVSADALGEAYGTEFLEWSDVQTLRLRSIATPAAKKDRDEFTAMLADRFFDTSTRIVREMLPGVLILGSRFPGDAPDSVIRACGRTCEVVSVNAYYFGSTADAQGLARFWALGGRPLMHTEYSWRASQNSSGNPNNRGAGAIVETQAERGTHYQALIEDVASLPVVIGSHWFEFADQSPDGRFDGENSNYGVVDIHNKPYEELLTAMKQVNARAEKIHRDTRRAMPDPTTPRAGIRYTPGQHPGRPDRLDLLADWISPPEIWGAPDASLEWSREGPVLALEYRAGTQYGAGINIFGPPTLKLEYGPDLATDLDGYQALAIEATIPEHLQVNIVLAEAGAARSDSVKFDTRAGDDGEGFISPPFFGTGKRETYRVPMLAFTRQQFFGNQRGMQLIDMRAMRNLGLQFQGEPERGRVMVYRFSLER